MERLMKRLSVTLFLLVLVQGVVMAGEAENRNVNKDALEKATFGGGCFWCLDPIFEDMKGVADVAVGYAGGHVSDPSYEAVCSGVT